MPQQKTRERPKEMKVVLPRHHLPSISSLLLCVELMLRSRSPKEAIYSPSVGKKRRRSAVDPDEICSCYWARRTHSHIAIYAFGKRNVALSKDPNHEQGLINPRCYSNTRSSKQSVNACLANHCANNSKRHTNINDAPHPKPIHLSRWNSQILPPLSHTKTLAQLPFPR